MKYISDVELMTRFENEFGPVKVDLLENIKRVVDETPGVEPEAFESTCKQIAAVVPDLTTSIIEALPDIISNFDLCGSCDWFKQCHEPVETNKSSYWIHDKTDNSVTCKNCGCCIYPNDILRGDAHFCPNCGKHMSS